MSEVLRVILYFVSLASQIFAGAFFIREAVDAFSLEHYFRFGFCVMIFVYTIICLARIMIGGLT